MKATKKQRELLDKTFDRCLIQITEELTTFKNTLVNITLVNESVRHDHDYEQFGKQAFLYKLYEIWERHNAGETIIKEAKKLIDGKYQ